MHSYFFALGEYDGVAIVEFPNYVTAVACAMRGTSTGAFARFETTALLTATDAQAAMQKAKDTKTGYKPPGV